MPAGPNEASHQTGAETSTEKDTPSAPNNPFQDIEDAELPLEQWSWGAMRFTDASIPNVCFYIRVHKEISQLELHERFCGSSKLMKALKFADLRDYTLQVLFLYVLENPNYVLIPRSVIFSEFRRK